MEKEEQDSSFKGVIYNPDERFSRYLEAGIAPEDAELAFIPLARLNGDKEAAAKARMVKDKYNAYVYTQNRQSNEEVETVNG